MSSGTVLATLVALSIAWPASAQPAAQKKQPVKKTPAAAKPAAKTPPPAPAPEPPPPPPKDVTYRAKYVSGPQVSENTAFIKGVRERFEFPGVTMITQCDLKRNVQLHDGTRRFMVVSSEAIAGEAAPSDAAAAQTVPGAATGSAKSKPQG